MASQTATFAVTGATGAIGGAVAQALASAGQSVRLVVREKARAPQLPGAQVAVAQGYHDTAAMTRALEGVETVFLVSGHESANRRAEHLSAVDAAVKAGVRRVVYTSFVGAAADATFTFARDHYATEQHLRQQELAFTFLRNSMYLDYMGLVASPQGVIAGPAGRGRFAPVAREDVVDVAVAILGGQGHDGKTYHVTGPQLYTFSDVAAELTRVSGRLVMYKDETLREAYASRAPYGAPTFEVEGWVTSYVAIARGELEVISNTVRELAGHPPMTLTQFLVDHPGVYAHLQQAPLIRPDAG